jgi:hypothetical protein
MGMRGKLVPMFNEGQGIYADVAPVGEKEDA